MFCVFNVIGLQLELSWWHNTFRSVIDCPDSLAYIEYVAGRDLDAIVWACHRVGPGSDARPSGTALTWLSDSDPPALVSFNWMHNRVPVLLEWLVHVLGYCNRFLMLRSDIHHQRHHHIVACQFPACCCLTWIWHAELAFWTTNRAASGTHFTAGLCVSTQSWHVYLCEYEIRRDFWL